MASLSPFAQSEALALRPTVDTAEAVYREAMLRATAAFRVFCEEPSEENLFLCDEAERQLFVAIRVLAAKAER